MISERQLRRELDVVLRRADLDPARHQLVFSEKLDREHTRNRRRYAEVSGRTFYFAKATLELPAAHRKGLLAHEVGHVVCEKRVGPRHTEAQADVCARQATGVRIGYDHRWPGKGLQRAMNPSLSKNAAKVDWVVVAPGSYWPQGEVFVLPRNDAERRATSASDNPVIFVVGTTTRDEAYELADRVNRAQIEAVGKDGTVVYRGPVMPWLRDAERAPYGLRLVDRGRVYEVALGRQVATPKMGKHKVVVRTAGAANAPNPQRARSRSRNSLVTPWR